MTDGSEPFAAIRAKRIQSRRLPDAADTLRAQGFRQLPVVVAGDTSWSGFRPDMINRLAAQGVSA